MNLQSLRQASEKPKLSKVEIASLISDIIVGKIKNFKPFPSGFFSFTDQSGNIRLLMSGPDGVVKFVDTGFLVNQIVNYCRDYLSHRIEGAHLKCNEAKEAANYVIHTLPPPPNHPVPIVWKSDPRLAFRRLPFDRCAEARLDQCPYWHEISKRMSNFDAFSRRLGSLFDRAADRKQAIYIHGPRDSGKSRIQAALEFIGGNDTHTESVATSLGTSDLETQFWKASLLGKRILILPEAKSKFFQSPEFKSLTGDLRHAINQKHLPLFTTELPVLLFFFSNEPPMIPNDDAIAERVINCRIQPLDLSRDQLIATKLYDEKLMGELQIFLSYCVELYEPYQGGKRIPCDRNELDKLILQSNANAIDFFDKHFIVDPTSSVRRMDVYKLALEEQISPREFSPYCQIFRTEFDVYEKRVPPQAGQTRPFILIGMRPRSQFYGRSKKRWSSKSLSGVSGVKKYYYGEEK